MANVGTVVDTYDSGGTVPATHPVHGRIKTMTFAWTCTSGGSVSFAIPKVLSGFLWNVKTSPGAGVSSYSVKLLDSLGLDMCNARGASRSTSAAEQFSPALTLSDGTNNAAIPPSLNGSYTLDISGAGNVKTGTSIFEIKE